MFFLQRSKRVVLLGVIFILPVSLSGFSQISSDMLRAEDRALFEAIPNVVDQQIRERMSACIESSVGTSTSAEVGEFVKIILFATLYAITYGVVHDQITVQVCRDYFCSDRVPHHKKLLVNLGLNPDTLPGPVVAGIWGVAATWWVGLILGIELACVARTGSGLPKLSYKEFLKPMVYLLGSMGIVSLVGGLFGAVTNPEDAAFQFNAHAHGAGYALAGLSLIALPAWVMYQRAMKLKTGLVRT